MRIDNKIKTSIQIGALFILPIALLYFGIIPLRYRFFILLAITLIVVSIVIAEKWSLKKLGIRIDNVKKSALPYFSLTVLAIAATVIFAQFLGNKTQPIEGNIHFQYGFVILSFLQEFLFRSFLIPKLKTLTRSPAIIIMSNAVLFGFLHLIFPNPFTIFMLTALLGLGFASVYYFRPNLLLASISHSIINFIGVFYCFASFSGNC